MRARSAACGWVLLLAAFAASVVAASPGERTGGQESIEALLEAGRTEEALERLDEARREHPDRKGLETIAARLVRVAERAEETSDRRLLFEALVSLADTQSELARYRAAKETLQRVEELWRQDGDPALGIELWNARARRSSYQGRPEVALEFWRRAVELARQQGDSRRLSDLLVGLGQVQLQLHDYAEALSSFQQALTSGLGGSRRIIAIAGLGIAHFELNQLVAAEETFEQARRMAVEAGNRRLEAWALGELGTTLKQTAPDRSLALLDRSIEMFAELGDIRNEIAFRINHGSLLRDLGRYQEALRRNLEAEARLAGIEGQRPNPILTKNIADCLRLLERFEEAEERYRRAIDQAQIAGERKAQWQAAWGMAKLFRRQGRYDEADAAFRQALEVIETLRGSLRLASLKTDFFENKIEVYADYIDFLVTASERPDRQARAFEIAERARARSFLDTLAESRADLHETLPDTVLEAEAERLDTIAEIQARIEREGPTPVHREELERAEAALEELYLEVRRKQPRFRDMRYPSPALLAEVQGALDPSEVLIEYFVAEPSSHLWIVSPRRIAWHRLPARSEIEAVVRLAYGRLVDPEREPREIERLARRLLAPLAGAVEAGSSLVIVPSGILHYFPFEILPFGEGILADSVTTSYVPSASTLVTLRHHTEPSSGVRLLAVGDPAYSEETMMPTTDGEPAGPGLLFHSRAEVRDLARRFGRRRTTLLLGPDATEERLEREPLASFSLVHLAAHGRVDTAHPERSALLFADPPASREDGLLQMREIYRLPLAAELVTLSACRTAMGDLVTGEGMVGLWRAFQYAGAESIVASLWSVSDRASARFMGSFYDHLERGAGKAEALRRARLELRRTERFAHPYYWGAYVLVGEGADGVRFPEVGSVRLGVVLLLLGLLGSAVFAWRRLRTRR